MGNITSELKEKLLAAKSVEDIAALLKEAGVDETQAERLWAELEHKRETCGKELNLDELETISGGKRDWVKDGCAATVEPDSWCWSDDDCLAIDEHYANAPVRETCPQCGMYFYEEIRKTSSKPYPVYYVCKACKFTRLSNYDPGRDKAK